MLKWDMIDAHMPWRMFISESIINGHFPLWNPYQDFGYPIHADMRSIWTPEIWIISLFGGYSVYTFSFLFVFYTSLAGIGMKFLSNLFLKDEKASFFIGLVYMLSGYFTAHAQELYTINSFVFIPIVLYHYLRFIDEISLNRVNEVLSDSKFKIINRINQLVSKPVFKSALYFIFFIYIILTSAYQAHSFILLYLLVLLFIHTIVVLYKKGDIKQIRVFLFYHIAFGFLILLLLLPIIVSAIQVFPFVQRLNSGVDASTVSILSFSPQSLLSLLLPFAVIRDMEFFNTDLSMTNLYFGIIPFLFFLLSLTKVKKNPIFIILLAFGFFTLLASFGNYTPLRKLLFDYFPFMNMFRGSAYFRLFTLIPFVISAGFIFKDFDKYKRGLQFLTLFLIVAFIGALFYSYSQIEWDTFSFLRQDISWEQIMFKESSFYENIFVQSVIQLLILFVFMLLIYTERLNKNYLIVLIVLDLIIAIQLNIHSTCVSKSDPVEINEYLNSKPIGFPIPESLPIAACTDKASAFGPLWRNTNIYSKRISADAFNSFYLDKTQMFRDSLYVLKDSVSQNTLLYFSNDIVPLSKIQEYPFLSKTLFVQDSIVDLYQFGNQKDNKFSIVSFSPVKIEALANLETAGMLTLLQTNYKGWSVYVDGIRQNIVESNTMFISVKIEEGEHQVVFEYHNARLINAFTVSVSILFLLLLLIFISLYKGSSNKNINLLIWFILSFLVLTSAYKLYTYHLYKNLFDNELEDVNTLNPLSLYLSNEVILNGDSEEISLLKLIEQIRAGKPESIIISSKNKSISPLIIDYLKIHYKLVDNVFNIGASRIIKFSGLKKGVSMRICTFDTKAKDWTYNEDLVLNDSLNKSVLSSNSDEYICSYTIRLDKKDKIKQILALVDIKSNKTVNPILVFSIDKDGQSQFWKGVDYNRYRLGEKVPVLAASIDLEHIDYDNNSILKVYIWNKDKENFKIDNFRIFLGKNN